MSIYKELSNDQDIDVIRGIQFTVMSPEEIEKRSVVEVVKTDTYSGSEPVVGGLFDIRMGVIEHSKVCKTCEQKNTFCPGHFGHITLAKPVFYYQFFDTVLRVLRCVCVHCSKMRISPDDPRIVAIRNKKISRQKRFDLIYKLCSKVTQCGTDNRDGCGLHHPIKMSKTNEGKILVQWKFEEGKIETVPSVPNEHVLYAEDVIAIFKRVTDTEADVMGFKRGIMRPEWLMCSVFPVAPPAVRPSVRNDTGQRCEDDLTHKLCDIVKTNNNLKKKIERVMAQTPPANGAPLSSRDPHIEGIVQLLQYHIFTFVNNNIPNVGKATQRTGRALRSIGERLKGKEGRIRGNLMGKRVDFSARSVITPDANISIDELGVPVKVAMNITFPEIVNKYNYERLKALVRNGPDVYPGAKYLKKTKEDNRTIRLKTANREEVVLEIDDVVDRHMQDGDYVLFNRQPSLHKMSMMAHRVKVMPYDTFRLNVCVTASYNADFDGDEMNLHMPQSLQSANELISLASVPTQIISPAQAKPIISIVQDVALGVYLITNESVMISQKQYFNLMSRMSRFNGTIPKASLTSGNAFTGKQAMSMVIPENVNLTSPNNTYADDPNNKENTVIIQNGEIIQGVIDKNIYQQQSKGLVHTIYNENGFQETTHLFDDTQRLICDFLVYYGFSIGISDLVVSEQTMKKIKEDVDNAKKQVYSKISDIHNNRFENPSIYTDAEYFETEVNNMLNKTADQLAKIGLAQIKADNRMYAMVMSKSKGNKMNIVQVMSALGQQNVDGKRIQYGYEDRTLPHFTKYDDGPETRGFIENSFMTGLKPHEFFFHAMGGREGLIDTAVKSVTAETPIVIRENGVTKYTRIGDWIDAHLDHHKDHVKHFEERQMEMLYLTDIATVYIPTTDYEGNVSWGELTAVTRHDPGTELYRIATAGGRHVIVTESKSLLVWQEELQEFREIPTPDIKVGDSVPATAMLPEPTPLTLKSPDGMELTERVAIDLLTDHIMIEDSHTYIPDYVFTTPNTFIIDFLRNLFVLYGSVDTKGHQISLTSPSARLLEGVAMLCSRLGVYGEIDKRSKASTLSVKEGWATQFASHLYPTSDPRLNRDLKMMRDSGYKTMPNLVLNDVVLDKIVEITIIDVSQHPKVYDVTVPSTLNFGLANGLQVRDTSETGYIQRKLVKGMEDCKITYDGTVRNANGGIVQFLYGEDGMNTIKLEGQTLRYIKFTPEEMANEYLLTAKDCLEGVMTKAAIKKLESNSSWTSELYDHFDRVKADREHLICKVFKNHQETKLTSAVAFERIIRMVSNLFCPNGNHLLCDLTPLEIMDELQKLEDDLHISPVNHGVKLFGILLRMWLSPKMVLFKHHLTKEAFYEVIQRIRKRFMEAIANPSEMVGVVAAQSIGEPCTQLTLNTFHSSGQGTASKAVRGVPRLKELLSVSKNIKSPSMKIYVREEFAHERETCKEVKNDIQTTYIKDVVESSAIFYDPRQYDSEIAEDAKFLQSYHTMFPEEVQHDSSPIPSPWILRLTFNRSAMQELRIGMVDLDYILHSFYGSRIRCTYADDNADELVMRIQIHESTADMVTELKAIEYNILENIVIKGTPGINKISIREETTTQYNQLTEVFETRKEYVMDTDGSNLLYILTNSKVDAMRSVTNDIVEIYHHLGIEAAREALTREIIAVLGDGLSVDYHHLSLLVDTMTMKGNLLSIDRHGINRSDIGPIAKCSFEETSDMLMKAGVFAEYDKINGVSANIMLGQIPPCGTGDSDIVMKLDKLPKVERKDVSNVMTDDMISKCSLISKDMLFDFDLPEPSQHSDMFMP